MIMGPRQQRKFIEENRDSLIRLTDILKEVDTVRENVWTIKYPPEVRSLAIELVELWIKKEFDLDETVRLPKKEDEGLYRRLERETYE